MELGPCEKGKDGWEYRRAVTISDITIAYMDYGGESQREWLRFDMSGKGCEWVEDWAGFARLYDVLPTAELRRVDVALDTVDGSVTHDGVLAAYESLQFKRQTGGRNPKMKKIEGSSVCDGRTIYIGARESARFIRCYEKGWERLSKVGFPEQYKKPDLVVDFEDGHGPLPVADRYRVEVEFKAVDDAVVPWPILIDSDSYFAGAAPFCASLVGVAPRRASPDFPSEFEPKATLAMSMEHCRIAYGGLLRTLVELYGDTPETKVRLFNELMGFSPSERLIKDGVLMLSV
jgi:phage replication initiation protein